MMLAQVGHVTPRRLVRRHQARIVLRDLERRGLEVTERRLELYAISRYAGELPYSLILEVVAAAVRIRAAECQAQPTPATRNVRTREYSEGVLTTAELRAMIRAELLCNPVALSTQIRLVLEAAGPLGIQPQSVAPLVSLVRKELGIPRPIKGRPRHVA